MSVESVALEVPAPEPMNGRDPNRITGPGLARPAISVVVPVYNSAGTLEALWIRNEYWDRHTAVVVGNGLTQRAIEKS